MWVEKLAKLYPFSQTVPLNLHKLQRLVLSHIGHNSGSCMQTPINGISVSDTPTFSPRCLLSAPPVLSTQGCNGGLALSQLALHCILLHLEH